MEVQLYMNKSENQPQTIYSHKMYLLDHLRLFYRPKKQISLPFHILQLVKSPPFHIPEAWKRYPFRAKPPRIGLIRSTPSHPDIRADLSALPAPFTIAAVWGTRNLIYILVFILLWLLLTIFFFFSNNLVILLLYSIFTLLTGSSIVAVFTAKAGHVLG